MGRISYTPSTISWLASQAGQSDDGASKAAQQRAGTPERCACSSTSCIDTDKCAEGLLAVPDARRHNKSDAPYVWSQQHFDPDDQSLPVVDETFLDGPAGGASLMQLLSFSSVEGDDDAEEDEEEHDGASESDEDHVEEGVADYTEEVTEEIIEDANDRFWALASPHTEAITAPDAAQQGGFSPSVGVFHSHTLPFFLPAVGSMQRRASNEHAVTPSTGSIAVSSEA